MFRKHRIPLIFSAAGALAGYLILHPYAMLVFVMMSPSERLNILTDWNELSANASRLFEPIMFPMALAFTILCAVIGLLLGVLMERRKNLLAAEYENEKKKIAIETLRRLLVILSHYFLNASMIIGGQVKHIRRMKPDKEVLATLATIEAQAQKTETVIEALREVTSSEATEHSPQDYEAMIEITRRIEKQMEEMGVRLTDHDDRSYTKIRTQ